uniref:Uncharacterized protein n=1 Tax=Mustela putorius furo TaxID=9669 RepID=M3XTB3_MUSPF
ARAKQDCLCDPCPLASTEEGDRRGGPFLFLLTEKGPRRDWRAEAWWGRVGRAPNLFTQTAHGGHPRSLLTPTPQPVSTACQASTCLIAFNPHKHFVKDRRASPVTPLLPSRCLLL